MSSEEFVPGTRYPLRCPHCKRNRRLTEHYVACGCISAHWIRYYPNSTPADEARRLVK